MSVIGHHPSLGFEVCESRV